MRVRGDITIAARGWLVTVLAGVTLMTGVGQATAQTALGQLAAAMPAKSWAALSTNNVNVAFAGTRGGSEGNVLAFSDEMVWDPNERRAFFLGGDHIYNVGDDLPRFVMYSDAGNSWQILPRPSWLQSNMSFHAYDHHAINPTNGDIYYRIGNQNAGAGQIHKYAAATGTWSEIQHPFGYLTSSGQAVNGWPSCCVAMEYFPELGVLIYVDRGSVWRRNEGSGQWSQLRAGLAFGGAEFFAEYNPVHKVVFFGGGNYPLSRAIYRLDATGAVTRLRDAPVALGSGVAVVTVDPVSGDYLVFTQDAFYVYDILKDTWSLQNGPVPMRNPTKGVFGLVATPVSTYGVNMFVACEFTTCKVHLYRHSQRLTPASRQGPRPD